jgi:lysophospholipase L1-like esterase
MPWFIWQIASGRAFFAGIALLVLAVSLRPTLRRRKVPVIATLSAILAAGLIAISATALPGAVYIVWSAAMLYWLMVDERRMGRWPAGAARAALICVTLSVLAVELPRQLRPSISGGPWRRLYVIGDSISAGLGSSSIQTWPRILRSQHSIEVVDLSRAGACISDARRRSANVEINDGVVLLEIGGNDLIGSADPKRFEADLDALCSSLDRSDRRLVMLELPLPPFGNGYGRAQRRVADHHHMTLIPRRYFAGVLAAPGATIDGIHLTADGQRHMAAMIWDLLGGSIRMAHSAETRP